MAGSSILNGSTRVLVPARARQDRTDGAHFTEARCEPLSRPALRRLHPLRPPRDVRPEHPQPLPLTIGAIPLLRRLLSFGLRWRRSTQRGGSRSAAVRCGSSLGCVRWSRRACSGSGTAIWWQVGMHVILASMSSIVHQLAFALYAWDVCARQRYPCVRCALRTLRPSVHDATAVPPSAVASSTV